MLNLGISTTGQAEFLNRQFGTVRFCYNTGLRIMSHRYKRHGQSLSAKHDIKKLLPVAKKSRQYGWLRDADSMALQQALINLDKAFQRFFDPKQAAPEPIQCVEGSKIIGLDIGLSHLAIDSTGRKVANPRFLKKAQKNLKRKQQALSRTKKGSARRAKARRLVAKAHERVANARNDFQHKLSRQIVDDNQAVIVETLKVSNMMKNAGLAKHIGDASWQALTTKLDYKAKEQGKHLVKIDPWFASSKTCRVCQHKMDAMPLNVRSWECPACHTLHDRDVNEALNIKHQGIIKLKAEGLSVSAHGGSRKPGMSPVAA
ncbi:RNA-guided endonuclease InsQ/TnpB family protein [Modicisalibacter luteus]|uniref:RNA-guided endonuclease InsQ/TnpB family protein n=1 Tax=Modicisalibacter luteus TaxID=453962 RepID=A0ABV7LWC2_9GAMM|nr:RNA-guided endonuclease TnpB family protein [Halomonas lutea]